MRTGRALSSFLHHTDQTRALDFSRDGNSLLTASFDGLVGVCDCRRRTNASSSASSGNPSLFSSIGAGEVVAEDTQA